LWLCVANPPAEPGALLPKAAQLRAAPQMLARLGGFRISWRGRGGVCRTPNPGVAMPHGKLHRSRANRMIAGVCGGIAEWLDWDPTLVRVLYVLVSIFSAAFPGILVYVILMLVMPSD
jgi:phage shock protein C